MRSAKRILLTAAMIASVGALVPCRLGMAQEMGSPIYLDVSASDYQVCKGSSVTLTITAHDVDQYYSPTCYDDLQFQCLNWVGPCPEPMKQPNEHYQAVCTIECDWIGIRDFRVRADDLLTCKKPDGNPMQNDEPETRACQVTGIEVASVAGPGQCVLCPGRNYTFTATTDPPGYCTDVLWAAGPYAEPNNYTGACEFTTKFLQLGDYTVTASCGGHEGKSVTGKVLMGICTAAAPSCAAADEQYVQNELGECIFGQTYWTVSCSYSPYFDCGGEVWKPCLTELALQPHTKYDWHAKLDAEGTYTCDAARAVWLGARCTQTHLEEYCIPACNEPYLPYECVKVHERKHHTDMCAFFGNPASQAAADIAALSLPPQEPYCSIEAAYTGFQPAVEGILDGLRRAIDMQAGDQGFEFAAFQEQTACGYNLLQQLCYGIDECIYCSL